MAKKIGTIDLIGNLKVENYELDNGLKVAIVEDDSKPIFNYQTWFRVGSADEEAGKQGLAHLFEHMMFRETTNLKLGEWEKIVNENGGTKINAYTSRDQTVYYFTFPNDKFELAAKLESERMRNLIIDDETFATEKGAVLSEKGRTLDEPNHYLWEQLYFNTYQNHNYKYSIIGETESIKNFTSTEARNFYTNFYAPNNALIIVVGDVKSENVILEIEKYYGGFEPKIIQEREKISEPEKTISKKTSLTHLKLKKKLGAVTWIVPHISHEDYPALVILSEVLAGNDSSLLNERLVFKSKVTQLFADAYEGRDGSTFEFYVELVEGVSFDEAWGIFHTAICDVIEKGIDDVQLKIVKNGLEKFLYETVQGASGLAKFLGESYINTGDLSFYINLFQKCNSVLVLDVQRAAKKYILDTHHTTVLLNPPTKIN